MYGHRSVFVSDMRHFLEVPDDAPGPARKMAEHLSSVVRAATAGDAGGWWVSALICRRRPGNRSCHGHIAVFRADLPAPIEWQCSACGDDGVITGWEDSPFDLRQPRSRSKREPTQEIILTNEQAAALRGLRLLDTNCERLVFQMRGSTEAVTLTASADELDELIGFVAAEANHEANRRRQKRLDEVFAVLSDALRTMEAEGRPATPSSGRSTARTNRPNPSREPRGVTGRWRIVETDLWDQEHLDVVAPASIEFKPDRTGRFGFIAVSGWMDWRNEPADVSRVEFSWEGTDEGDQVSGRGWARVRDDGCLHGHIYFHLGDDTGFRAERHPE